MHRKLTLNVDALSVASFQTALAEPLRDTVIAREEHVNCPSADYPLSCGTQHTCVSFDIFCRADA